LNKRKKKKEQKEWGKYVENFTKVDLDKSALQDADVDQQTEWNNYVTAFIQATSKIRNNVIKTPEKRTVWKNPRFQWLSAIAACVICLVIALPIVLGGNNGILPPPVNNTVNGGSPPGNGGGNIIFQASESQSFDTFNDFYNAIKSPNRNILFFHEDNFDYGFANAYFVTEQDNEEFVVSYYATDLVVFLGDLDHVFHNVRFKVITEDVYSFSDSARYENLEIPHIVGKTEVRFEISQTQNSARIAFEYFGNQYFISLSGWYDEFGTILDEDNIKMFIDVLLGN